MKKKINIPLILVTIIIWGIIIYSIIDAVWFNPEERLDETKQGYNFEKNKKDLIDSSFEFEYLEKDPFKSARIEKRAEVITVTAPIVKESKREEPFIKFSVGGVVINGESKKIVFNDETNSNVVFLKEGDSYQGLKVIKVTKSQVEFLQLSSGNKLVSQIQ